MKEQSKQSIPLRSMEKTTPLGLTFRYAEMTDGQVDAIILSDKNVAHRDDYFLFIFVDTMESFYLLDFEEVQLKGKSLLYIRPGQVHFASSIKGAKGWALAIDPMLIDDEYKKIFEERFETQKAINPQTNVTDNLENICRLLLHAVQAIETTTLSNRSLLHLANVYIGVFAEQYAEQVDVLQQNRSRSALIAYQFRNLLSMHFKTVKSPSEYAQMMNYSLSHLNESVKTITGLTVSYWIQQQIVLEAKRMLYYTELDVKEIAFRLGYEDHTYFTRLFSKVVGSSPSAFRSKFHE